MKFLMTTLLVLAVGITSNAQNLPFQWTVDEDAHMITIGDVEGEDFYDPNVIRVIEINFEQADWWDQLEDNYEDAIPIEATVTIDGETYEQCGVRFKGQTSYFTIDDDKKSFNITLDEWIQGQDHDGYEAFNLQNGAYDPSFLREFIYETKIRRHIPAALVSFTHLYLNGEDWGLYPNVEQLNKEFLEEWFIDENGTRWRADSEDSGGGPGGGGGGGGGPQWGDGTAALNWLGADESEYQEHYTLKTTNVDDPWADLINTCDVLENTPLDELEEALNEVMDVDRTLWFLASEILFSDDDGYVYKGKMDYFLYFDTLTQRMIPLEYDGNTVMEDNNVNWSPFYHADDENYPLLYRMMQVPSLRQRYLAHMRTLLEEVMYPQTFNEDLQYWADFIDAEVQADPKKLYTYNQFNNEVEAMQEWAEDRYNYLVSNSEISQVAPQIVSVTMSNEQGEWQNPLAGQDVTIEAEVTGVNGVQSVLLHWSNEITGHMNSMEMTANGDLYTAVLTGDLQPGEFARFYIEAIGANEEASRSYSPAGAAHDVYYYTVEAAWAEASNVVINELMARNGSTAYDENGQDEDWIELYNTGSATIDLSGYYLTDNGWNLDKWPIPEGTTLAPDDYLIVWADEDQDDGPLHANFKLSGDGETLWLITPEGLIADMTQFEEQEQDMGWARIPNGVGEFEIHAPTFGSNNDFVGIEESNAVSLDLFPNPASNMIVLANLAQRAQVSIYTTTGQLVHNEQADPNTMVDISSLANGVYVVVAEGKHTRLIIRR